jgi:hypothetical protein
MKSAVSVLLFASLLAASTLAQSSHVDLKKPLVIASQGSFYVGGEKKALPAPPPGGRGGFGGGDVTVNQMYVQYQVPPNGTRHLPVVMVQWGGMNTSCAAIGRCISPIRSRARAQGLIRR